MQPIIDIATIKKHLNIDSGYTGDDTYISSLCDVAVDVVEKHIDCTLNDIALAQGGTIPAALRQCILLYIGNLYMNRESVAFASAQEVPQSLTYILNMYRDYNNANI